MDAAALERLLLKTLQSPGFRRANFGGPRRTTAECPWLRISIRRLKSGLQIESFDRKQSFAKPLEDVASVVTDLMRWSFSAIHLVCDTEATDIRISKKGKIFQGKTAGVAGEPMPHDRVKDVPLPENESNALFSAMGILDRNGRVRPALRNKFTQINEFLKHVVHLLGDSGLRNLGRAVEILDCGCGASHLTLALHFYLQERLGIPARILGVDVNHDVIRKSVERAEKLGADQVQFQCARIDALNEKPDVVIALHACDTATDAALAAALRADAKLILAVPCCHHHLNAQLKAENVEVLRPILRHGILHERQADLLTDAFRALILRIHGYRAEIVEFISPEHTARNLMIRAVKTAPHGDDRYQRELEELKQFAGVSPYLETLLK